MTDPLNDLATFLAARARRNAQAAAVGGSAEQTKLVASRLLSEEAIAAMLHRDDLDVEAKRRGLFRFAEQAGLVGDPAFKPDWIPDGG